MLPTPRGSSVTSAGMSNTTQCQNPLPVGASGSKHVTAYDCVPSGAPDQLKWGDWLSPVHPMTSATCSSGSRDSCLMSSLVTSSSGTDGRWSYGSGARPDWAMVVPLLRLLVGVGMSSFRANPTTRPAGFDTTGGDLRKDLGHRPACAVQGARSPHRARRDAAHRRRQGRSARPRNPRRERRAPGRSMSARPLEGRMLDCDGHLYMEPDVMAEIVGAAGASWIIDYLRRFVGSEHD